MNTIVVAPFSNGDIRDWPLDRYAALMGLLVDRWDGLVRVIGTRSQSTRASEIVRAHDATRVTNECGHLTWDGVIEEVRSAACVIGNNSGVTHLSGWLGVPTVCVFGGSHQRTEWKPMGLTAYTISHAIGCAPCHLHRARDCPFGKACLSEISPELVADTVFAAMAGSHNGEAHHGV